MMKAEFKEHYVIVGQNIRRLRNDANLTQLELANRCSVNREQISRMENATRDYMHSTLLQVCKALNVSIFDIMKPLERPKII